MDKKFDSTLFDVKKFFSYPCVVVERVAEYEERGLGGNHGNENAKQFFNACLKFAEEKTGKHLMDNKIAFEIYDKTTGETFYTGYKDNIYCIGNSMNPYMESCYVLNLDTQEKSSFKSNYNPITFKEHD